MTLTANPRELPVRDRRRGGAYRALRALSHLRREPPPEPAVLAATLLLAALLLVAGIAWGMGIAPPSSQVLPVLGGGLLLRRRALRQLLAFVTGCFVFDVLVLGWHDVGAGAVITVVLTAAIAYEFARSREETGLVGLRGDTLLVELRARLQRQGALPALPAGWGAEQVLRPAGGGPFAGDFVVSSLTEAGSRLEVALVDVSGKGNDAATRALMLSGALGGLLGAAPDFLAAANGYLCRQNWEEGFATAVHVRLELGDGSFLVDSAGHPPAALFSAGSGRWSLIGSSGTALGLTPGSSYQPVAGRLEPGDALLLYTDGLVEVPGRDLSVGIDKLLGEAERLVSRGFAGGGQVLVNRVAAGSSDDRALVLIWRSR